MLVPQPGPWRRGKLQLCSVATYHPVFPKELSFHGDFTQIAPSLEKFSASAFRMARFSSVGGVQNHIRQILSSSRRASPAISTSPWISSAYAGTGVRRRSSIRLRISGSVPSAPPRPMKAGGRGSCRRAWWRSRRPGRDRSSVFVLCRLDLAPEWRHGRAHSSPVCTGAGPALRASLLSAGPSGLWTSRRGRVSLEAPAGRRCRSDRDV